MTMNLLRMSASPTRPAESGIGAVLERGLDTSNGLDFVRERLALVGKTLFLVSFGFYPALMLNYRNDLNPVRTSATNSFGCSQAAK
ncbi:MAG TPA: hypothetical protein VES92_05390 [Nitrospiraceae bacterium]|nr:hypothetical protein [Nitrospiraceae bacterium]